MTADRVTPMQTLPCGCRMGTDETSGAFIFEAHSKTCQWYAYVIAESERQGKPILTLGDTELDRPAVCPWCDRCHEIHSSNRGDDVQPKEGDISLCYGCRKPGIYQADGSIRKPSDVEAADILADPGIRQTLGALAESYTPREAIRLLAGDS